MCATMKRQLEETDKVPDISGGNPHSSPPQLAPLTLATVSQPSYAPRQTSELHSVAKRLTFTAAMPAVTSPLVNEHVIMPASPSIITPDQQQQQIQRLKVKDAIGYLDMVKLKFADNPHIYNNFLDIMKDFKSQSIDTPGVIDRVSDLFNGHPEMIVGFNTFLPPGYKIEVKTNEQGHSLQVQVIFPSPSTFVPTSSTVHHTAQLANTPLPSSSTVVTKPLILSPVVAHPPLPPMQAVTHFAINHSTPTISEVQAHQAVSQALNHVDNAINYVNKIKIRFQGQPEKYKKFLEILHAYQKRQHNLKAGVGGVEPITGTKQLTEAEVYSQVAKLFEHQEDLLAEFGQFLPDSINQQIQLTYPCDKPPTMILKPTMSVETGSSFNNNSSPSPSPSPEAGTSSAIGTPAKSSRSIVDTSIPLHISQVEPGTSQGLKRSLPSTSHQNTNSLATKNQKLTSSISDVSLADAAKYGSLNDFAFFDKVRKSLWSQSAYKNFLRCVSLFTLEVVSRSELVQMVTPFLEHEPELFHWFKDYTSISEEASLVPTVDISSPPNNSNISSISIVNNKNVNQQHQADRPGREHSEIDFTTCRKVGASYCELPKNQQQVKCSGRTPLCKEVLNDTWVSFPSWAEDSTFVSSRKTIFEEHIYKCEEERFELDVILEVNLATIHALEVVHKKLCRLSSEEAAKFTLNDCLGGSSPTIHKRAIMRIYGGDKGLDIIDGLKKNPVLALPIVLKRLKLKDIEWRESQTNFNKQWRERNEKYYLKSLDHQGINFKQNDMKALRSKSLLNEIETCYEERNKQAETHPQSVVKQGPLITLQFKIKSVLDDAANLLIYHVKRQTNIHKEDKQRIKQILYHLIPDFFYHPRQELREDECESTDNKHENSPFSSNNGDNSTSKNIIDGNVKGNNDGVTKLPIHPLPSHPEEKYTLFLGNCKWYLFLRLHHILCERLAHIYDHANTLIREEAKNKMHRTEGVAAALRLKPKNEFLVNVELGDYYMHFLEIIKNVLAGNMDLNVYEDTLREMFGIHAYHAFTLYKVVAYAVRQLQHIVVDKSCTECTEVFLKAKSQGGTGGTCVTAHLRAGAETAYQRKVQVSLGDEKCFKFFIYNLDCKLAVELLDGRDNDEDYNQAN